MPPGQQEKTEPRPHTGRRRNEQARQAILTATLDLLRDLDGPPLTVDAIAAAAGVGKQTIYRWWPSKGAVVLEAMTEHARTTIPVPDTGTLVGDLERFLSTTFRGAHDPATTAVLRTVMAEAQHDEHIAVLLREFIGTRRVALRSIFQRAGDRGELVEDADLDLAVDQCFGVLWYRMLVGHAPLSRAVARGLARSVVNGVAG